MVKAKLYQHHFQPIVHMASKNVHGLESLLRTPELTSPEMLFQSAIHSNCLFELDMMSIRNVFEIFSKKQSNTLSDLYLFVNVFPSTVSSPIFYKQFTDMLSTYHLNGKNIVLELNELEAVPNYNLLKESMKQFRQLHVKFALDDFGEGVASFKNVIELDLDYVKLDQYFANSLSKSSKKQQLLKMILPFFLENDIEVIIEGIETKADLNVAQSLGIQLGQGFLFGKPKELKHFM